MSLIRPIYINLLSVQIHEPEILELNIHESMYTREMHAEGSTCSSGYVNRNHNWKMVNTMVNTSMNQELIYLCRKFVRTFIKRFLNNSLLSYYSL